MHHKTIFSISIVVLMTFNVSSLLAQNHSHNTSPYAGEETNSIKALTDSDIHGLLSGSGTPFNGMAKPAELNGYPGPKHVLEAYEEGDFELTNDQYELIKSMFDEMQSSAIPLGEELIHQEEIIESAFQNKTINLELLSIHITKSSELYAQLRILHLGYHLKLTELLTAEQVEQYNLLRGYSSKVDPCKNIPSGHDPEMWKMHNNCGND